MDKQGRLTKWEELELGAIYEWRKGRTSYGRFVVEEINRPEGWIGVRNVDGVTTVRNFNWQRRYRKV